MKKRILALFLCLASLVAVLAGCSGIDPMAEDKGQQITMYLTETVYDLDPAHAYINESSRTIVSLLFDTLFVLNEKGKVKPSLAKDYTTEEKNGEYFMYIELNDTNWSDNTPITADDVVYAWKRVLTYKDSHQAAVLLYDIKNARAYSEGEVSKDDIGLTADGKTVTIQFEGPVDYDQFILNLTSLALAPLRESIVEKGDDWAKKPGTMVCSGPYKLSRISFAENSAVRYSDINYDTPTSDGYVPATASRNFREKIVSNFVLERNAYYYRDSEKDEYLDKSVRPYRIIVDCAMSDEDIKEAYRGGTIMYIGDVPMSLRQEFKDEATIKESLSTNTLYFNQNADIDGTKLFAKKEVRQALSMAIDRNAIASGVVYADAASGLVPWGVFESNSPKSTFRPAAGYNFKYLSTNMTEAKALLASAGIDPTEYSFSLTYAAYDEVHKYIAESVVAAWNELGFDVTLNARGTIANNDYYKYTDSVPEDMCDDLYAEDFRNSNFEVILLDTVAISADPFSMLAPFAKQFSGMAMDMSDVDNYIATPHITGYDSEAYNALMEEVFNEKNPESRSSKLREAEAMLLEDMPVIPIIFNKLAYLVNDGLDENNTNFFFWKDESNYYGADPIKEIQVKHYDDYIVTCRSFLESKFDTYKKNPLSYFYGSVPEGSTEGSWMNLTFAQFMAESSNYAYLFKGIEIPKE